VQESVNVPYTKSSTALVLTSLALRYDVKKGNFLLPATVCDAIVLKGLIVKACVNEGALSQKHYLSSQESAMLLIIDCVP